MRYITYRRFKGRAICGMVNLPAGTICDAHNGFLTFGGKPLCVLTSENAHQHFARNDDGKGMERGQLIRSILNRLQKQDDTHQDRWDKVWDDPLCQKYKRADHADNWLWNHAFFNASIADLTHIWNLIKAI